MTRDETYARDLFHDRNPRSRIGLSWITTKAGSKRRRYVCVACRRVVDTESAQWRQTVHAERAIDQHLAECKQIARYVRAGIRAAEIERETGLRLVTRRDGRALRAAVALPFADCDGVRAFFAPGWLIELLANWKQVADGWDVDLTTYLRAACAVRAET